MADVGEMLLSRDRDENVTHPGPRLEIRHTFSHSFRGYSGSFTPEVASWIQQMEDVGEVVEMRRMRVPSFDAETGCDGEESLGCGDGMIDQGVGVWKRTPSRSSLDGEPASPPRVTISPDRGWNAVRISHREYAGTYGRGDYVHTQYLGQGVRVYVLDTGVDINHPGFDGFDIWAGPSLVDQSSELERSKLIDAPVGADARGHATMCASVITGVRGLAPNATVISVKVVHDDGISDEDDVFAGIDFVLQQPGNDRTKVISFSSFAYVDEDGIKGMFGFPFPTHGNRESPSNLFARVVQQASDQGVHFVGAAGNDGVDACSIRVAGASAALVVGSINGFNRLPSMKDGDAEGTNLGPYVVVFAPGSAVPVLSIRERDLTKRRRGWGTSVATPHVAAVVAARLSEVGPTDPADIRDWLAHVAVRGQVLNGHGGELVLFNGVEWSSLDETGV